MSTPKHTPGPWYVRKDATELRVLTTQSVDHGRIYICEIDTGSRLVPTDKDYSELNNANAQRIVDCVNACEGINPAAVQELIKMFGRLTTLCKEYQKHFYVEDDVLEEVEAAVQLLKLAKGE